MKMFEQSKVSEFGVRLYVNQNFRVRVQLAQPISDKIWPNYAIYDTSIKVGTHLEYISTTIFGYRAFSDFALEGVGAISKMAAENLFPRI